MESKLGQIMRNISTALHNSLEGRSYLDVEAKQDNAAALGLEDMSEGEGSLAVAVGAHHDLPNIIVKVVPKADKFVPFAQAILDGKLSSPHFPDIHGINIVGENAVILVERIANPMTDDVWHNGYYDIYARGWFAPRQGTSIGAALAQLQEIAEETDACPDFHCGNVRTREDGTLVFIDPLWSPSVRAAVAIKREQENLEGAEEDVQPPAEPAAGVMAEIVYLWSALGI